MSPSTTISSSDWETCRKLLTSLGNHIRQEMINSRRGMAHPDTLAEIAEYCEADVIYKIDRMAEDIILSWFFRNWPEYLPVELVMEGLDPSSETTFPANISVSETLLKCILDPIDGTRMIMYDKRSAWSLAAIAPQRGSQTCLSDIHVAVMTELPTTKQGRSDQFSAIRGHGIDGIEAYGTNLHTNEVNAVSVSTSRAINFDHGFASLAKFFPAGRALTSKIEEILWDQLAPTGNGSSPLIFDDQYLASGGQIAEMIYGHDRMVGDLRPLIFAKEGLTNDLTCHPYDICTALILTELGGIVCDLDGNPLSSPLDTTSPVTWIAYANKGLADLTHPILRRIVHETIR